MWRITDIHSKQELLFDTILRELPNDDRAREFLQWFIGEYQVDLLARSGQFLLKAPARARAVLAEYVQGPDIRYCVGHKMHCVVSKTPLRFFECEEYQIDHIYMYSSCIEYRETDRMGSLSLANDADCCNPGIAPEQDRTDQTGPKVQLIWVRYPNRVHSICLPNFLLTVLQSEFGARAKSARS